MSRFQPSKVKDARLGAGMTQAELARAAATTEKNIHRWENGHNEPRAQHIAAIAAATGVEPNYFFGGGAKEAAAPPGGFRPSVVDGRGPRVDDRRGRARRAGSRAYEGTSDDVGGEAA